MIGWKKLEPVGRLYYSASTTVCYAHSLAEDARSGSLFTKTGFGEFRTEKATPFNLIIEAKA
jgi:hypothetical protein